MPAPREPLIMPVRTDISVPVRDHGTTRIKPRHWLFVFLLGLTVLRWVYAGTIGLSPDEAYYFMWAQRPDLAYFSKGPGVAMAIRFSTAIFGENEFGVRFLSPLLALGTSLAVFFLARKIHGSRADGAEAERVAIWTVVAMNAIPIIQVGGLVMTIDALSIFFWAAALWTFWLALECSPRFSVHWPLTGFFIGLGFLSKYTNGMQLLSVVLLLATNEKYRRELARPGFWSMLAVCALCAVPPLIWNQRHGWITVAHLLARGHLDAPFRFHPLEWVSFFGALFGVYSPLIFAGMLATLWWSRHDAHTDFRTQFLLWFAVPLLAMYSVLALNKAGQPNWTAPAFISLGILTAARWYEAAQTNRSKAKFAIWALGIGTLMGLGIVNMDWTWKLTAWQRSALAHLPAPEQARQPWWRQTLAFCHKLSRPYPYSLDPSARLHGWKDGAQEIDRVRQQFEHDSGQKVFLIANSYGTAAELAFYLPEKRVEGPGHPRVYIPASTVIENQFSFWPRYDAAGTEPQRAGMNPFRGRTALYITDRPDDLAPPSLMSSFAGVKLIELYDLRRHGELLRTLRIFACDNYKVDGSIQ